MFELVASSEAADIVRRAEEHGPSGGYLASPPEMDDDTTLATQMIDAARAQGLDGPTALTDFAIDVFDCEALLDRVPRPMSRGERQLCGLLITLTRPFDALYLIDPTAGLDARRRRAVVDLLRDIADDRPVACASDDELFQVS